MFERRNASSNEYPFEFSVIMAVYNVEQFLEQAVDSLITQTFGFERIQLIMVDDGSSDSTPNICDEYARNHPKNVIVIHKPNGGVASARNEGLKYATGRYLNFMDSDDYFTENAFELVYDFFRNNESEIDVVTIPLHFFDAQKGEHWQNGKFKRGTRVLDLYWDYQSTLMFVNASFFANHLKDEIIFDSHLVCGEDIKVILTVLIHKMKMGVVDGCRYMYRRRSAGEASLIQSSKKKKGWYFDYFTYLVDWAVAFYQQQLGYLPSFVQYELLCDIQWRYREIYDMTGILTDEEIVAYKVRVAHTLKYFDDRYILEQKMIWNEHKNYMRSRKYNCKPTLTKRANNVMIHYGNTKLCSVADQYSVLEFIELSTDAVIIEGYTKIFGVDIDEPIEVYLSNGDKLFSCEILKRDELNEYRFGDLIYRGIQFKGKIPLSSDIDKQEICLVIKYRDIYITKKEIRYGKFAPLTQGYANAYYWNDGWAIQCRGFKLLVYKCSKNEHLKLEIKFLKELWNKGTNATRKALIARTLYLILSKVKKKEIWLISDRALAAGDNGEALFKFLREYAGKNIKPYYVIHKGSPDFERMKQYGSVVPYLSWKHKMLHLLSDKIISSHADAPILNPFFKLSSIYRDLMQKQKFVFLQHGITTNDLSKWYSRYQINAAGYIASALPEYEYLLDEKYGYTSDNIWLTGFPRYDSLYHEEKKKIMIVPTWRAYLVSTDQMTGKRSMKAGFEKSSYFAIYSELLCSERLGKAAKQLGYEVHFISHPNMSDSLKMLSSTNGTIVHTEKMPYNQIFAEGSLLVTDYSSVAFDFCYLRKPVIYCHADEAEFFGGEHTLQRGYFDYAEDGFGEVEYSVEKTIDRIIEYMEHGCELKEGYRNKIDKFFAFNDNTNCQRVYEAILEAN